MRKITALVALCLFGVNTFGQDLLLAATQGGAKRYSLAVLNLVSVDNSLTPTDIKITSDNLTQEMRRSGLFYAMSYANMERGLLEVNIDPLNCMEIPCAVRAGRALGVQLVVIGTIQRTQSSYTVDAKMVHVASRQVVKEYQDSFAANPSSLSQGMVVVAQALIGGNQTQSLPQSRPYTPPPATVDDFQDTRPPYDYTPDEGGFKWQYVGLGLLVAGGVGAGLLLLNNGSDGGGTTTPPPGPNPTPSGDLPGPPTFP